MTAKELYEQLKEKGLENAPLFISVQDHNEYESWSDTDEIDGFWIDATPKGEMIYLMHSFYE